MYVRLPTEQIEISSRIFYAPISVKQTRLLPVQSLRATFGGGHPGQKCGSEAEQAGG